MHSHVPIYPSGICTCTYVPSHCKDKHLDVELVAMGEPSQKRPLAKAAGFLRCRTSRRSRRVGRRRGDARRRRTSFSEDEEDLIVKLHALLGDRWSLIAGRLPGRTGDEVENHWNSQMRTKLGSVGIDHPERRRNECDEHLAKCLSTVPMANGGCDSDTGSSNRADHNSVVLPELNLELTLSMPSSQYFANKKSHYAKA